MRKLKNIENKLIKQYSFGKMLCSAVQQSETEFRLG